MNILFHTWEWSKTLWNLEKLVLIKLSCLVNDQERKTTYLNSNQMVKTFNSRTKRSFNHLKQISTT